MLDEFLNLCTCHLVVCSFHFIIFRLFTSNYILWQDETSQNISIYYIYHSMKNDFILKELPCWLSSKFICNAGDVRNMGLTPMYGGSPRGEMGNPLQCSCQENHREKHLFISLLKESKADLFSTMGWIYSGIQAAAKGFHEGKRKIGLNSEYNKEKWEFIAKERQGRDGKLLRGNIG